MMLGGMLAGHDQGGGEIIIKQFETNEIIQTQKKINRKDMFNFME